MGTNKTNKDALSSIYLVENAIEMKSLVLGKNSLPIHPLALSVSSLLLILYPSYLSELHRL